MRGFKLEQRHVLLVVEVHDDLCPGGLISVPRGDYRMTIQFAVGFAGFSFLPCECYTPFQSERSAAR